jgi:GT2 family glycosyltransferase
MPTISIQVVTYNSAATIEACLRSALEQRGVDFEIRVLDNASADGTVDCVQRLGVPVVHPGDNLGYAAGHNRLIDATESDYVLTLNPDVILQPGFLDAMGAALEADNSLGSASGCLLRVERLGDTPAQLDGYGLYMRRSRRQGLLGDGQPISARPTTQQPIFGPDGAVAFYRRAMLDDIRVLGEVFDADFFMHKEDVDVCWRAQLRGWASVSVPGAVAHHVRTFRPGQRGRVSPRMRFLGARNRYLLMLKNEIPAHFWRDLPHIAPYDAGIIGYLLLRERESLPALASAWGLRGRLLAKRRIIQAARRAEWQAVARWFV